MKHAPKKKNKNLLITTILAIIAIGGVSLYFIGNASTNKTEKASDSSLSVSSSHTSNLNSNTSSSSNQLNSSTQLNKDQESKQSAQKGNSQSTTQSNTPNQSLVYYNGQSQITLPTTNGTIDPQQGYPDGGEFWPTTLTINGQQENVIASYSRQGYFAIYTKKPTNKPQGFTYNGDDLFNHIGDKNLDALASSNQTIRY